MRKKSRKAVAVEYRTDLPAPFVSARGQGHTADRIIALAEQNGIPVVNNDFLTEALSVMPPGDYVPEQYWEALAAVFVFIARQEERT